MAYAFPWESDDLDIMLADSLHSIAVGSVSHQCLYELRSELGEENGGAAGQVLQIEVATIKAAHFQGLAEGNIVVVTEKDSWQRQYTIVRMMPADALTELLLQRA